MGASTVQSEADQAVYQDHLHHSSSQRLSSIPVITSSLRAHHPDYFVTSVPEHMCDLRGFAEAGNATVSLDSTVERIATKKYAAKPTRWSIESDSVGETPSFLKLEFTWEGKTFLVYLIECSKVQSCDSNYYFILRRSSPEASAEVDSFVLAACRFSQNVQDEVLVFDRGQWAKSPKLWKAIKGSSWEDVILDEEVKKGVIRDVEGFYKSKDSYKRYGIAWKRGIILYGVPGNGKTISVKAIINTLATRPDPIPTLYVKSLKSPYGPQFSVAQVFNRARSMAPCLLVLEDIDSLIDDEIRSYFLNEVDGLSDNDGLLILGTTNHLDKLDPAIVKRPSRFDRKYPFLPPSLEQRTQYMQYWQKKLDATSEVHLDAADCPKLAELMDGFTFAYMKEAIVATLFYLFSLGEESPGHGATFGQAFERQVEVLRVQMSEEEEAEKDKGNPVAKVTVESAAAARANIRPYRRVMKADAHGGHFIDE